MKLPYHIECILKNNKITDFLGNKNIFPAKEFSNKKIYHCPLHEGDNDPSFVVYIGSEYENYFCYACKKGGNYINLVSDFDKISIRSVVKDLVKGININEKDVINSLMEAFETGHMIDNDTRIEQISLKFSKQVYNFLKEIDFKTEEVDFFNNIFKIVDKVVRERDIETLRKMFNLLPIGISERVNKCYSGKGRI